jgi:hypothetical protein
MTLAKHEVHDLLRVARSIPRACEDERLSWFGKAAVVTQRAEALALGLECIHTDMTEASGEMAPAPPPRLSPWMSPVDLDALTWHSGTAPARNHALQQLAALPGFVSALARCDGATPESHAPVITAYIVSILKGLNEESAP